MPPETDNLKLEDLFNADQKERGQVLSSAAAVETLKQNSPPQELADDEHGEVNTAVDLYRAGVIFCDADPKDFLIASPGDDGRAACPTALALSRNTRPLMSAHTGLRTPVRAQRERTATQLPAHRRFDRAPLRSASSTCRP